MRRKRAAAWEGEQDPAMHHNGVSKTHGHLGTPIHDQKAHYSS